jgi:hypothetical protein
MCVEAKKAMEIWDPGRDTTILESANASAWVEGATPMSFTRYAPVVGTLE